MSEAGTDPNLPGGASNEAHGAHGTAKFQRALDRNRRLQRKRENTKKLSHPHPHGFHQVPTKTPWTSAQRRTKPHRSARALMRTCLAKGSMATCTDVPSVYLGRGSRSRKLARKPSVTPLLSLQQDMSLRPAQGIDWIDETEQETPSEPSCDCSTVAKALEALKDKAWERERRPILLALEQLMADPSNLPRLVDMEGVKVVLDCLQQDAAVASGLLTMVTRNAKGREQVMAADGVRLLVTAMRHSQSWEVQENCCKALKELAVSEASAREQLKDDGLQVVLDAMKKHLSVARVQVAACGVLRNTCACSSKYQAHLISLGAGQRVLQGMARHNKDATVQCACCWALFCLCAQKCPLQQEMARQGALPAVLRAMRLANPKVQEAGCWVLRELATTLTSNVQLWLDVVQAVSTAMRDHAGQEVQKAGLAARQRLALRGFKLTQLQAQLVRPSIVKRRRSLGPVLSPIPE
ncbi:unnamed protein product [Durusdinium trenchii]|uniref:Uncharacterized protein n=1 Tax=Durusdinium trenchii TaxID=1381693 RepID=A0ABP0PKQ4_9DINO